MDKAIWKNGLNLATDFKTQFGDLAKASKGSKVINWIIQNLPGGKQTIIIL